MRRLRNPHVSLVALGAVVAFGACAPAEADGLPGDGAVTGVQDTKGAEDADVEVDVDELHDHEGAGTAAPSERHRDVDTAHAAGTRGGAPDEGCRAHQVDVNEASPGELERIVHIGSARAEQLQELRPFIDVRELTRISGIGERRLRDIVEQDLACTD